MNEKSEKRQRVERINSNLHYKALTEKYGRRYSDYRDRLESSLKHQVKTENPLQLSVELCSFCNLMCKMCYRNYFKEKSREFISMDLVDKLVAEARRLKIPGIWLGLRTEGLLHPDITTIIKKFGEIGAMDYWVITNGTKLTKEISEVMISVPTSILTVSLDAATPDTYKKIRGASLESTTRNIMDFIEMRDRRNQRLPGLRVSFVVMEDNIHEKQMFIDQWKNIADFIDFQELGDFNAIDEKKAAMRGTPGSDLFSCGDAFNRVLVKYNGDLWPCCGTYEGTDIPNISEVSLKEFWESEQLNKLRESLLAKDFLPCCETCAAILSYKS